MANRITTLFDFNDNGGLKKIQKDIAATEGTFKKMGVAIKGAFNEFKSSNLQQGAAIAGVGFAAKKAIDAASDLNESINAVKVTFGDAAQSVLAIGENSAESFGLSKSAFNEFAVQFSAFAKNIAESQGRDVADVIQEMTQRTADFASVMNLDLNEAAQVFMSTMSGETEPIRRFGKDVSAAAVESFALANGLVKSKNEMTEAVKVQARYGLLMQQTADTQGDFANTSDGLANSQRILAAQWEDLQAKIGEDLAPALQGIVQGMQNIIKVSEALHLDDVFGFLDDFDSVGTAIGHFFSPWNIDAREANEAITNAFNDSNKAAVEFDRTLLDGLTTFADVRSKVLDLTGSQHAANVVALEWAQSQREAGAVVSETGEAAQTAASRWEGLAIPLEAASGAFAEMTGAAFDTGAQIEAVADAEQKAAEAADRHREAVEAATAAMEKQRDAAVDLVGGDIAVRDAQRRAAEAAEELNEVLDNQETTLAEAGAAVDAAADAQLNAAAAAADYRAKQMEANGQTVDARTRAQLMKEELERLAGQLKGPLAEAIQAYIAQLGAIPKTVGTTIVLTKPGRVGDINPFGRTNSPRASGGPTYPGLHEVIENGPELLQQDGKTYLMSKGGGNVVPISAGGSPAGGGSYVINVYPRSGDVAPEAIVDALKRYERRNGTGWRS